MYLRNRSLTNSVDRSTPYEAWSGRKPAVNHLKVFGCVTYAHIPKEERRKLDVKAKRCVLLGNGTTVKGYRLYCPQDKKVFYSRDVKFDESKVGLEKEQVDNEADEPCKLVEIDVTKDDCQVSQQDAQKTVNHDDVPPDNNQVTQMSHQRMRPVCNVPTEKGESPNTIVCGSIAHTQQSSIESPLHLKKLPAVPKKTNG